MAAKKHYFGVGGGSRRFLSFLEKDGESNFVYSDSCLPVETLVCQLTDDIPGVPNNSLSSSSTFMSLAQRLASVHILICNTVFNLKSLH